MDNQHKLFISIPLNISDLENPGATGMPWEDIQWEDFEITENDFNLLLPLFDKFDKAFNIIIDMYEDEIISAESIEKAIALTEEFMTKSGEEHKDAANKVYSALKRAKTLKKPILLVF